MIEYDNIVVRDKFFVTQKAKELKRTFEIMLNMKIEDEETFTRFLESLEREIRVYMRTEINKLIDEPKTNTKGKFVLRYCEKLQKRVPFVEMNGIYKNLITGEIEK